MRYIILDTNFLLIPVQFKVDIFTEIDRIADFSYKLCIIDRTIDELNHIIKSQKGKHKKAAELGLKLLKTKDLKILPSPQNQIRPKSGDKTPNIPIVDDIIAEMTKKDPKKWIVATQDSGLKSKLRLQKVSMIILRQKKYLKLV